jgi:hypothetical protein
LAPQQKILLPRVKNEPENDLAGNPEEREKILETDAKAGFVKRMMR